MEILAVSDTLMCVLFAAVSRNKEQLYPAYSGRLCPLSAVLSTIFTCLLTRTCHTSQVTLLPPVLLAASVAEVKSFLLQTPTSPNATGSDPAFQQQRSPALGPSQTPPQPSPMRSAVSEPVRKMYCGRQTALPFPVPNIVVHGAGQC